MIVLSIGSNLGDRLAHLRSAVAAFTPWLVTASSVYETPPWGPVEQGPYLNAVLLCAGPGSPLEWLARARAAEDAAGRVREVRWGPRTLDVDVIAVDTARSASPELVLPHPRARERAFVLVPWLAADADATLDGAPVQELIAALPSSEVGAVRLVPEAVLS